MCGTIASADGTHTSTDPDSPTGAIYRSPPHPSTLRRYIPTIIDRKPPQNPAARGALQIKRNKPRQPTLIPSDAAAESRSSEWEGEREGGSGIFARWNALYFGPTANYPPDTR